MVCRSAFIPLHLFCVTSLTGCAGISAYASPLVAAKLHATAISVIHPHDFHDCGDVPDDHAFTDGYSQHQYRKVTLRGSYRGDPGSSMGSCTKGVFGLCGLGGA